MCDQCDHENDGVHMRLGGNRGSEEKSQGVLSRSSRLALAHLELRFGSKRIERYRIFLARV